MRIKCLAAAVLTCAVAAAAAAAEGTETHRERVSLGFAAGARAVSGGGPYGAVLFHIHGLRFLRIGVGAGGYSLGSLAAMDISGGYREPSARLLFLSGEVAWPDKAVAPKLHLEFGPAFFSYSYYGPYLVTYRARYTELFYSAAPGVDFRLSPTVRLTCEGGLGFQTWGVEDDWDGRGFKYGIFNLGIRFVF
ncbi:MAG: hypothetical protein PVH29_05855 [Candidatus Zixiibacteriota bacterium]|jgi:hypothetical protein